MGRARANLEDRERIKVRIGQEWRARARSTKTQHVRVYGLMEKYQNRAMREYAQVMVLNENPPRETLIRCDRLNEDYILQPAASKAS
jgi:hypothetical protein